MTRVALEHRKASILKYSRSEVFSRLAKIVETQAGQRQHGFQVHLADKVIDEVIAVKLAELEASPEYEDINLFIAFVEAELEQWFESNYGRLPHRLLGTASSSYERAIKYVRSTF